MKTLTKEMQAAISPSMALGLLQDGNKRFVNNLKINRNLLQQANETSDGQHPFAVILSCIDSRTSAELIFDQGLGDIFSVRIAGNILNEDILGSMEFGVHKIGVKLVVVLGHTKCGAIAGACSNVKLGNLTGLLEKINPAIDSEVTIETDRDGSNPVFVDKVAELNVHKTMDRIRNESSLIAEYEKEGKIKIVGGMYSVETGGVTFFS